MTKQKATRFLKLALCAILTLLCVLCFACCSSSVKNTTDNMYSYATEQANDSEAKGVDFAEPESSYVQESQNSGLGSSDIEKYKADRKVIYKTEITIETKDYDNSIKALNLLIEKYGAYVETSDVNNSGYSRYRSRYATYVIRIPKDNYTAFIGESGNIGVVTRSMDRNTDVTEVYIDTEARLETLKILEARLLVLLEKSDNIVDILELEQKLSDTRYEIENLTGSLRKYDSLIAYSTATININEVEQITPVQEIPKTFGQKISDSFLQSLTSIKNGFGNLTIALVYALPIIITFAIPVLLIIALVLAVCKKLKSKKTKKKAAQQNNNN